MDKILNHKKKRGPRKKPGFRQELRVTPVVEELFCIIKEKYALSHNSDALHKLAQIVKTKLNNNI